MVFSAPFPWRFLFLFACHVFSHRLWDPSFHIVQLTTLQLPLWSLNIRGLYAIALPLGMFGCIFLSTVSPPKMGNQTIVVCIAPSAELPWSLPFSLFLSCQQFFGSIIKIWRLRLLWHPKAKPLDAGARTRKPHWPCDTEGMDKIISLASIRSQLSQNSSVMFFFLTN